MPEVLFFLESQLKSETDQIILKEFREVYLTFCNEYITHVTIALLFSFIHSIYKPEFSKINGIKLIENNQVLV